MTVPFISMVDQVRFVWIRSISDGLLHTHGMNLLGVKNKNQSANFIPVILQFHAIILNCQKSQIQHHIPSLYGTPRPKYCALYDLLLPTVRNKFRKLFNFQKPNTLC